MLPCAASGLVVVFFFLFWKLWADRLGVHGLVQLVDRRGSKIGNHCTRAKLRASF